MIIEEIEQKYTTFKEKEGDTLLIKIGVVGVVIGLAFSMPFLNQLFAWFILFGAGIKLFDYVLKAQKKFENKDNDSSTLSSQLQDSLKQFQQKEGDIVLIKIGIVGVLVGLVFSISFINQLFAWIILLGVGMKIYNFVSDATENIARKSKE